MSKEGLVYNINNSIKGIRKDYHLEETKDQIISNLNDLDQLLTDEINNSLGNK